LYIQTRSLPSPKIEKNVWANGGYLIFFGGQMAGKALKSGGHTVGK